MTWRNTILVGDVREQIATLPAASVHCVVTSPPYWGLRDYGTASWEGGDPDCDHKQTVARHDGGREQVDGFHGSARADSDKGAMNYRHACAKCGAVRVDSQLGLEATPDEYVSNLVAVFREVRRVLRADGTVWLNLGDSYAAAGGAHDGRVDYQRGVGAKTTHLAGGGDHGPRRPPSDLKAKDLVGIPWLVAFALRADGWYLRSDIVWSKPNPMPESVTDRPTKAHEYLFLLSKSERYYYDVEAIKEPSVSGPSDVRKMVEARNRLGGLTREQTGPLLAASAHTNIGQKRGVGDPSGRNRRSVWEIDEEEFSQFLAWKAARAGDACDVWRIATEPYAEAHFATYPTELVKPCILAGTSERGACSECGAPWRRVVERTESPHDATTASAYAEGTAANRIALARQAARAQGAEYVAASRTIGWEPTCKHEAAVVPCVVLDPFMGSGTTGLVAYNAGRDFVGVELNPTYAAMADRRIGANRGRLL